jgi:hypothetical protein
MNTPPENDFDLEKLFLPAWAQEPATSNRYADFSGREDRRPGDPPRNRKGPPSRRSADSSGPRPRFDARRDSGRPQRRTEDTAPLPEVNVTFVPEEKGVDSISRQIRASGRAYPLFDIAQMALKKPERHQVRFEIIRKPDGKPAQPLFLCALDDSLWLSADAAVRHVLEKHFATFYEVEKTPADPPKGTYTFVAQCGMSGVILGPPNYHSYQTQLRKLHAERFSRMPFEAFKARVRIVRDEAVVKQWIDEQSWRVEYNCLNVPEPKKLGTREEVERHFREVHMANIVQPVDSHTLPATALGQLRDLELRRLAHVNFEQQKRFPIKVATVLSQQFATRGLQFFKVNKTVTHVAVSRPHFLDMESTPVSEGIKRIVDFINAHPKCTRKQLFEALAPSATAAEPIHDRPAEAPAQEGEPAKAGPSPIDPIASDLHWLLHEGHVIEFANGMLDTAKKPAVRPPKPQAPKQAVAKKESPATEAAAPVEPEGKNFEAKDEPAETSDSEAEPAEPATSTSPEADAAKPFESALPEESPESKPQTLQ